jgi:hypothetical protein
LDTQPKHFDFLLTYIRSTNYLVTNLKNNHYKK